MTAAETANATLFRDIDRAVVGAVGSYADMMTFRQGLRGGAANGAGNDITSGQVPRVNDDGLYELQESVMPAVFVSRSTIEPLETGSVAYTAECTAVLPSIVNGAAIGDDDVQEFADLMLQAIQHSTALDRTSISDRLVASAASGAAQCYTVRALTVEGLSTQPRVVAQVRFEVPASLLVGSPQGIVEG